jgi:hypothetical protein
MMIDRRGLGQGSTADDIIAQYQAEFAPNNPFVINNPSLLQNANATIVNALSVYCSNNPGDTSSCSGSDPLPEYVAQAGQIAAAIPAPLAAAAAAGQTTPIATPETTTANNPGPVLTVAQEEGCPSGEGWDSLNGMCMSCGDLAVGAGGCPITSSTTPGPIIPIPVLPTTPVTITPVTTVAAPGGANSSESSNTSTTSGFAVPAFLTDESISGVQNWVLIAGGLVALLLLPSMFGGRK